MRLTFFHLLAAKNEFDHSENIIVWVRKRKGKAKNGKKIPPKILIRIQKKAESDSFYFDLAVVLGLLSENAMHRNRRNNFWCYFFLSLFFSVYWTCIETEMKNEWNLRREARKIRGKLMLLIVRTITVKFWWCFRQVVLEGKAKLFLGPYRFLNVFENENKLKKNNSVS